MLWPAILFLISISSGCGVQIFNGCNQSIYRATAVDPDNLSGTTLSVTDGMILEGEILPGDWYSEPYWDLAYGGVSIKLGRGSSGPITQLEYTVFDSGSTLSYDISNVNCGPEHGLGDCPFVANGIHLESNDSSCEPITCQPGVVICEDVYNYWDDDRRFPVVKGCGIQSQNLALYLCQTSSLGEYDSAGNF